VLGRIAGALRPALRRLAALGAAAALAAGGPLAPQPAAAAYAFPMQVTYDSLRFTKVDDGVVVHLTRISPDSTLELYGEVAAYTSAGPSGAGGQPYLGLEAGMGQCVTHWGGDGSCDRAVVKDTTYYFSQTPLCAGSTANTCFTSGSKYNNTIPLWVRPGEQIILEVNLVDYDALSANDPACVGTLTFGPYTAAELIAKKYVADSQGKKITMPWNGHGECQVAFHFQ
jgi:hypothetical protein